MFFSFPEAGADLPEHWFVKSERYYESGFHGDGEDYIGIFYDYRESISGLLGRNPLESQKPTHDVLGRISYRESKPIIEYACIPERDPYEGLYHVLEAKEPVDETGDLSGVYTAHWTETDKLPDDTFEVNIDELLEKIPRQNMDQSLELRLR